MTPKRISPLAVILLAYFLLTLVYTWATPIFEASDEYPHIGMIEYIANERNLPVQVPGHDEPYHQEGSQPPLYYALSAALILPFDITTLDDYRPINPHAAIGLPDSFRNKNYVVRDPGINILSTPVGAFYLVRLFSIALGAVTITAVYHIGRLIAPQMPLVAIIAAGLLAVNPMFLFISSAVNNDNLVTALAAVVIYLLLLTLRDGFAFRRSLLMAFLIAMATLTKLSGLVLVPVVAITAIWIGYRDRDWRGLFALGFMMASIWALLAGWWYVRNIILYNELFGTHMMVQVAGERPEPFTFATALAEFEGFRWSFWGVFGLFNIIVPFQLFYILLDLLVLLSGVGLSLRFAHLVKDRHQTDSRDQLVVLGILFAIITIGFVAFLQWTAQTYASQGRLIFPYIGAILPLVALGWVHLWTRFSTTIQRWAIFPLPILGIAALLIPVAIIAPAYNTVQALDNDPTITNPIFARYDTIDLIGYEFEDRRYAPGDTFRTTLYWQVRDHSDVDYSLFLTLIDPAGDEIGKVDSYPGTGSLRTSTWLTDSIYADTYEIIIDTDIEGRFPLQMQVGWWHFPTETPVPIRAENGDTIDAVVLNAGAFASVDYTPDIDPQTPIDDSLTFGNITLLGYTHNAGNLTLYWENMGSLSADYTVFVQVIDSDGEIVAQGDAPPQFPTSYWRDGERYVTNHVFTAPDAQGTYNIIIGWYHPELGRLPTANQPDNAYTLTQFEMD